MERKNDNDGALNLGGRIAARLVERGMTQAEFGRRIGTSRQNVSLILERDELQTDMLYTICEVLAYDFFATLRRPAAPPPVPQAGVPKVVFSVPLPAEIGLQRELIAVLEGIRQEYLPEWNGAADASVQCG